MALAIFAATVFWFFNALNKTYTTNLSFPIAFEFNREEYIPVQPLPENININVTGIGWNLFRRSLGVNLPALMIPLEKPAEVRKIVGATLPSLFSGQLESIQINFVLTDTIMVNIQEITERWLSLTLADVSPHLKEGFGVTSEFIISPDSVFVRGPLDLVSQMKEPYPIMIAAENIDQDFSEEIPISFSNEDLIQKNPAKFFVAFSVDQFVEVRDTVKLEYRNFSKRRLSLVKDTSVYCVFSVPENRMAGFHPDSLRAIIDFRGVKDELWVKPKISSLPPYVNLVLVDTVQIPF